MTTSPDHDRPAFLAASARLPYTATDPARLAGRLDRLEYLCDAVTGGE